MAFDPTKYSLRAPKRSLRKRLLEAHGYTDGRCTNNRMSIIKTMETFRKENMAPDATPEQVTTCYAYCRYDTAIWSNEGEKFSEFMERLGWLVRDESGKLVPDIEIPEY